MLALTTKTKTMKPKLLDIIKYNHFRFILWMCFLLATSMIVLEGCDTQPVPKEKYIPEDVTISILVDLNISLEEKKQIYYALEELFDSINDGGVFLSFFGDSVGKSEFITKETFNSASSKEVLEKNFSTDSQYDSCFYSALYAKLSEFGTVDTEFDSEGFLNSEIACRSKKAKNGQNLLVVFTEHTDKKDPEKLVGYTELESVLDDTGRIVPKVYVFEICKVKSLFGEWISGSKNCFGGYIHSESIRTLIDEFENTISEKYEIFDQPTNEIVDQQDNIEIESKSSKGPSLTLGDYLMALLVALLTILFYILVMKVMIPGIKSWAFEMNYYQNYNGDANIQCWYCKKDIKPGERIVNRCEHKVHIGCWKEHYCCPEYGQNCKVGVQRHVDWKCLPSMNTLREFYFTIAGVCAGLVSWVIYSLSGKMPFGFLSKGIVNTFYLQENPSEMCITTVSSFLILGLLLAFSISFAFRCNNGVRKKDWKSLLRITGWSLLSGIIGMAAFALGGIIFCLLSPSDSSSLWSYSLLAYLLFSVCIFFSLTIRSSMSIKNALVGGLVSAMIGFLVLFLIGIPNPGQEGTKMLPLLLNFVIFGGGLGASIVIARKLVRN